MSNHYPFFAPQLIIRDCKAAIDFYQSAFGVSEQRRWSNADGSVHVAALEFAGCLFHIHEPSPPASRSPDGVGAVTTIIGLFVEDPDAIVRRAVAAGAELTSPVQDYEYGLGQGALTDPFGHQWLIQRKI